MIGIIALQNVDRDAGCCKGAMLGVPDDSVGGRDKEGRLPPDLNPQRVAMNNNDAQTTLPPQPTVTPDLPHPAQKPDKPAEYGGPKGLEPTRYGDWEKAGRCIDF